MEKDTPIEVPRNKQFVLASEEYFRPNTKVPKEAVSVLLNKGGLGDNICRIPAIKYLIETNPHVEFLIWAEAYFLELARYFLKDYKVRVNDLLLYRDKCPFGIPFVDNISVLHDNLASHMVDTGFHLLVNKMVDESHKNYPQIDTSDPICKHNFSLPKKYVVLTTGFTVEVREMLPGVANNLIEYFKSKNLEVILLGKQDMTQAGYGAKYREGINYDDCIDLREKTNIFQAAKILHDSEVVVGLDNGLLHLAACTGDVPIVAGFTTVDPQHRLPIRNGIRGDNFYPVVNSHKELGCRHCQSNVKFLIGHDFRYCIYKDYKCTEILTAGKYIEQLEKVL